MLATIRLKQMRFHARHGVAPEEGVLGQQWIIDLDLVVDIAQAAATDELEHTVNYAAVYSLCQDIVVNERFALIETLANHLLSSVLSAHPKVKSTTVTIHKPQAPIPGIHDGVSITATLSRN
jgi:7,8-dihydroneopterin aldolase/epimerase/oxygenase